MSDRSDGPEDDSSSRKRHFRGANDSTPSKRTKSGFLGSFFSASLNSFFDMFGNSQKNQNTNRVIEVLDDDTEDDESIVVVKERRRNVETSSDIVFLNADNQRFVAGKTASEVPEGEEPKIDDEVVALERTEEKQEDDIILDKTVINIAVTKTIINATIDSDDSDEQNNDIQEIPSASTPTIVRTREVAADDDDLDVQFEKIVRTPNRNLMNARKMQNELIFLNDDGAPDDDGVSVQSELSTNFISPTPDDSISRSQTPLDINLPTSSSRNPRDFWRRSEKKPAHSKRPAIRLNTTRVIPRIATSVIQKSPKRKDRKEKSSLETYMKQMMDAGYISQANIPTFSASTRKTKKFDDLLERAQQTIAIIKSRSNSPASMSRQSSIVFDRSSAGTLTPSTSSDYRNNSSHLLSKLDSLTINQYDKDRYRSVYDSGKLKEVAKEEELKVRQGYRAQTKDDVREGVTKTLQNKGIFIRPKPEKIKRDEFAPLPESADELLQTVWTRANPTEIFSDAFNIQIQRQDLLTLNGLNWLNDNIINFYLQMICERSTTNEKYPRVYTFNTFFYTNVVEKGYASVKRWTRKVDIFSYSILLVPVHLGVHWTIAIIDIKDKKIEFYDSLYDRNPVVLSALDGYLKAESLDKKKVALDTTDWTIQQRTKIPKQKNGSDCGVFSCQFAEWASRRKEPEFSQDNMPYYRRRMVHEIVTKKLMSSI